jgi:hypothetical protein
MLFKVGEKLGDSKQLLGEFDFLASIKKRKV